MARTVVCILWAAGAAVVYVFTGTTAALLILCAALALPLCAVLAALLAAGRIMLTLELPGNIPKGETVQGEIRIRNRTPVPVVRAVLHLELENTLTQETELLPLAFSIPPFGKESLPFTFRSAYCGRLCFKCGVLTVSDTFGLIHIRRPLHVDKKRLITPELFPMRVRLTGSETPLWDEVSINLSRKGQDWSEPFQIRDYVEGDSLKQIHWKLSQKLERYIVTDPSQTLDRALLVFWDRSALAKDAPPRIPDTLAEAVVSFCLAVTQEEIPYSVAWSGIRDVGCAVRDVDSMDDLYGIIPGMLEGASDAGGMSGISDCIRALDGKQYPLIAYFSDRVSTEIAGLAAVGRVTLFLCGEDSDACGDLACHLFSPADYRQSLCDVTI
ncbi:Protein of unknown function DUF58 [Sporobacter termitidis DSM 10068]|uniref:Uncharacterized protein n=1 Tax=Sporobacter termitidis DSM 10068 TaxID=1123282 RepID=A0A1M5YQ85_9FIRM|nr:DUF58 domain-containing protein [Sporobacter termitidis]SHI14277.1 Protein of unknown function DUF58 [Sporobacter termitidis DSM 10068]